MIVFFWIIWLEDGGWGVGLLVGVEVLGGIMKFVGFGVWFFFLGVGEVCGVILGEWRGEDLVDSDIFGEDVK